MSEGQATYHFRQWMRLRGIFSLVPCGFLHQGILSRLCIGMWWWTIRIWDSRPMLYFHLRIHCGLPKIWDGVQVQRGQVRYHPLLLFLHPSSHPTICLVVWDILECDGRRLLQVMICLHLIHLRSRFPLSVVQYELFCRNLFALTWVLSSEPVGFVLVWHWGDLFWRGSR